MVGLEHAVSKVLTEMVLLLAAWQNPQLASLRALVVVEILLRS
jgi:hypothetical protein